MSTEELRHTENPTEIVAQLRKELTSMAISGHVASFRGVIVSNNVRQELQNQNLGKDPETLTVLGSEGHRSIKYSFYVQNDPSLPVDYVFVHHTKEAYKEKFLGKVGEVMQEFYGKPRRSASFGRSAQIVELNPFNGVVEVKYGFNGSSYYNNVDFDDVIEALQKGLQAGKKVDDALEQRFGNIYQRVVNNPPEAKWTGEISFYPSGKRKEVHYSIQNDFIYHPDLLETYRRWQSRGPWVGAMFIQSDRDLSDVLAEGGDAGPFRIVGIIKDGFGKLHPYVLPGSEQTDPMEFAKVAIQHFLPEEIFVGTCRMQKSELEAIQALPVREFWGRNYDKRSMGRIEESWSGYEDHPEYYCSVRLEDSRANAWGFDLAKAKGKEEGDKLRAKYFPEGWKGWPETETALDRALAIFAAGF